jgi:hypothetical protein
MNMVRLCLGIFIGIVVLAVHNSDDSIKAIMYVMAIIIATVVETVYQSSNPQRRTRKLKQWANKHGVSFFPKRRKNIDKEFPEVECLKIGSNRYGYNFMKGDWRGHKFIGFDYEYDGGKDDDGNEFSVVTVKSKTPLKPLLIRPEPSFDNVKYAFGFDDINFESAEFSKNFHVSADDREWAYHFLHVRAIAYILDHPYFSLKSPESSNLWIQLDHDHAIVFDKNSLLEPDDFGAIADCAVDLLELMPEYLIREQTLGLSLKGD